MKKRYTNRYLEYLAYKVIANKITYNEAINLCKEAESEFELIYRILYNKLLAEEHLKQLSKTMTNSITILKALNIQFNNLQKIIMKLGFTYTKILMKHYYYDVIKALNAEDTLALKARYIKTVVQKQSKEDYNSAVNITRELKDVEAKIEDILKEYTKICGYKYNKNYVVQIRNRAIDNAINILNNL